MASPMNGEVLLATADRRALQSVRQLQHKQGGGEHKKPCRLAQQCVYKEKCHGGKKLLKAKGWRRMRCMCICLPRSRKHRHTSRSTLFGHMRICIWAAANAKRCSTPLCARRHQFATGGKETRVDIL